MFQALCYLTWVVSLDPNNMITIIVPILQMRHQIFEVLNLKTLLKVPQAARSGVRPGEPPY